MKVLKIGAIWCNSCNVMRPRWKKVEAENTWLETEYYEYDDAEEIVKKYELEEDVVPAFIFLDREGNEIERHCGEISEKKILEIINRLKDK